MFQDSIARIRWSLILKFFRANSFINLFSIIFIFYIIIIILKNFKINNHQGVSRAFNILHYNSLTSPPEYYSTDFFSPLMLLTNFIALV